MICPKCGADTPDGIPNCIQCGTAFNNYPYNPNIDYQQIYYKQKIDKNQNIKNSFNHVGNSIESGMNNLSDSISSGFKQIDESVSGNVQRFSDNVSQMSQNYKNESEIKKKGDDALIMAIVALAVDVFFGGLIVLSLVLGIVAKKRAEEAYPITHEHNHELAKTLAIIAIIISSIELGIEVIGGIAWLIFMIFEVWAYSGF